MATKHKKIKSIKNKEWILFLLMIVCVVGFWSVVYFFTDRMSLVKDVIGTSTGIIAAIMVWVQLNRATRLNEACYIKDLNNQFITNKDMGRIEHALELYYNEVSEGNDHPVLRLDIDRDGEDCQKLINYLVYLECLSSIIQQDVLHIEIIHNVFAYRFFLAVNNPVVQMAELIPFSDYYNGCFVLAKKWQKEMEHNKGMAIPLRQSMLNEKICWPPDISIRKARATYNEAKAIAKLLYQTDEYIYSYAFNKSQNGIEALTRLIQNDDGLLSYKNIAVAERADGIVSAVWYGRPGMRWSTDKYWDLIKNIHRNRDAFMDASTRYFETITNEDDIEIIAVATDKGKRRKGYAKAVITFVSNHYLDKKLALSVLEDNVGAVALYEGVFFEKQGETKEGFAESGKVCPKIIRMVRVPLCKCENESR